MEKLSKIFPIWGSLQTYRWSKFRADVVAGITVATILIPQGLAYAMLAGVPPIYGLYTALVPLVIYALLGTSRFVSIGPVAISSLLVLSGVSMIATPGSSEFLSLVILAGLLIGIGQFIIGAVKLGFIVNFISHPVMTGFTSAAAIIILSTQLKDGLGIAMPSLDSVWERGVYAITHIQETHWLAITMCVGSMLLMYLFKKIHKAIPGALIVIIIGTLISFFLGSSVHGLDIIGEVPAGLPSFQLPNISLESVRQLFPVVLTVTIIGIVETISIAKVLEAKHKTNEVNVNRELMAIGSTKIVGSFFQAIPSSASFTRSAVNSNIGSASTLSSLIAAVVIAMALLFLTPLFYYLPLSILAAIILMAVVSLFNFSELLHLWKTHRNDFVMMLVTFTLTLLIGIEEGVLIGVLLSIASVLIKSSKPHVAILGRIPETEDYRNIARYPDAIQEHDTIIVRFDDQLYFANAEYFKEKLTEIIASEDYDELQYLVLDASNMHEIDSTGIKVLKEVIRMLEDEDISFHMCGMKGPVRDRLFRNGLLSDLTKFHMNISTAVAEVHGDCASDERKKRTVQSNFRN